MPAHIQITFSALQPEQQEMLIAHLAEAGYEGFEEDNNELKAFISEKEFDKIFLRELVFKYQLTWSEQRIPEQNWNAVWESAFPPVVVDDFVAIRADFHQPIKGVEHEIVITPKMSFGTGHHATTYMMIKKMRSIDFGNKKVFDFGTGTGILAILAEKLGAATVVAIDNDEWSIVNAEENTSTNDCHKIQIGKADSITGSGPYDIILANINRNVILDNFGSLVGALTYGGILLLSGLLSEDETAIREQAEKSGLIRVTGMQRNDWVCLQYRR
jgi:ribosomal protein L11 methyltransferase